RQFKHIIRSDYADMLIKSTGIPIINRIVLYCCQSFDINNGYNIKYRNAGNFLHHIWKKNLPKALQEECKPLNLIETASLQNTQLSNTCSRSAPLESYDDDFSPRP
ncbi:MAG: hypothetical protein J5863_04615, partial [Desulfovibrio sp.]|nr:hypothetical protein [Desulfovibrio sp.]